MDTERERAQLRAFEKDLADMRATMSPAFAGMFDGMQADLDKGRRAIEAAEAKQSKQVH